MFSHEGGVRVVKNFIVTGLVCCSIFLTAEVNNAEVKKKKKDLNPLPDTVLTR